MNNLHPPRPGWNPFIAFGLALGVFVATYLAARAVPESVTEHYPWARQAVSQGLTTAFALGWMALSRRPFGEFGFRRPVPAQGHFKLWGLLLGFLTTGVILGLGLQGMRKGLAGYGLLGIVLWIWVVSSIVEEIFCRGWFQSLLTGTSESDPRGERSRTAVLWSAALFGAMHLPLLLAGIEIAAVVIIIASVTSLGYVCAAARARTGSLRPAIAAHMMFNIGGFLAGVIYTITYRIVTGHLPSPPN